MQPEAGKTYQSSIEPRLFMHVESVDLVPAEGEHPATFFVEGCEPEDIGDYSACGYEFNEDEWNEHGFLLADSAGSDQ